MYDTPVSCVSGVMLIRRLQDFVDEINSSFIAEGPELMRNEFEREGVKLHATVLNSKFLERLEGGGELEVYRGKKREQPWMTINASGLFKVCCYVMKELLTGYRIQSTRTQQKGGVGLVHQSIFDIPCIPL